MLTFSLSIIVGLIFLVWSADRFVAGSAAIANNFGVPHIIIGVTIVSLGTSAPEIIVAIFASLEGKPELAMGNAIGSNIANIGLVLGITALVAPIPISKRLILNENLILMVITVAVGFILFNFYIGRIESSLLILAMVIFLGWIYIQNKSQNQSSEFEDDIPSDMSNLKAFIWFVIGLGVLLVSARVLVWGATGIAKTYGISDAIIGSTIVAVGTSLPELAASVSSALKKHHDIAIGNVVGSNIFNLLAVLAVPGLIAPSAFAPELFNRDYLFMAVMTIALFLVLIIRGKQNANMGRYLGGLFVLMYMVYGYVAFQAI
ncbi:calcium/sodium antiporter [Reinekea sp.]|jgi:cation:H+ antiporter|uniref:calcium/sodium antiporter n=2 Tax=Reinekea sp. TaxID=1970455 RepID=UPI003989BC51